MVRLAKCCVWRPLSVLFAAKKSYEYLDIHWAVELGDAEFQLLEAEGAPRGQFRVGSSSKEKISKAFASLEDELVACKMCESSYFNCVL